MKESLEINRNPFEGLSFKNSQELLRLINEASYRKLSFIKTNYEGLASNFMTTLDFLKNIGLIEMPKDQIVKLSTNTPKQSSEWGEIILNRLYSKDSSYRTTTHTFLQSFSSTHRTFEYRPCPNKRSVESPIRNFYLEAGIIKYSHSQDVYFVPEERHTDNIPLKQNPTRLSPSALKKLNEKKEKIGLSAEKSVIQYEKQRLGNALAQKVLHSSVSNCALGYDIESVTDTGLHILPRYIEVKAISLEDVNFFFSRDEMNCSKQLGKLYYLYLVPISAGGVIELDNIQIFTHPNDTRCSRKTACELPTEVYSCRLLTSIEDNGCH